MDVGTLSLILLIGLFVLLVAGVPLGFATGVLGGLVIYINFGVPGLGLVLQRVYHLAITYAIIAVPLFIVMASLLERSGIAKDMYDALNIAMGKLRGGVAIVTTVMAVVMAAMSGIIGGEIVLLGLVALPQMLRLGYDKHLAIGTICAGGSLGTMIPPSVVLIIYGLVTETSITALFTAAFVPGADARDLLRHPRSGRRPIGVILVMMLIFLILGMFMDWIGIVLLTMPVFMPIVKQLGYDPIRPRPIRRDRGRPPVSWRDSPRCTARARAR